MTIQKKKRSWRQRVLRGVVAGTVLLAVVAWLGLPKYFAQMEKTEALSMQAMLIDAAIAQESLYAKQQQYTAQWAVLVPYMSQPASLQPVVIPSVSHAGECFFGFGPSAAKKQDGYQVFLSVDEDGQGGLLRAVRTGGAAAYTLTRAFPDGTTQCTQEGKGRFCELFSSYTEPFELKNLVPVSSDKSTEK